MTKITQIFLTIDVQCTWETRENTHAFGAKVVTGISTVEACRAHCARRQNCVAFDFRRSNSECYPHFDANDLNLIASDPDLDFYRKLTCTVSM